MFTWKRLAGLTLTWALALLACCCGDCWAGWLVVDAVQDTMDEEE